jgi:hypothetical protein
MDLVDHGLDAVGPFGRVGYKIAGSVSFLGGPAIVDVNIFVSDVL